MNATIYKIIGVFYEDINDTIKERTVTNIWLVFSKEILKNIYIKTPFKNEEFIPGNYVINQVDQMLRIPKLLKT